ncbi:RHS repeat-associated core domain-containing protein [Enterobacter asburiae]
METSLFSNTPTVAVFDGIGHMVRNVEFYRHPDAVDKTEPRVTRHRCDARGFRTQSADPRLHDAGLANFSYQTDLTGNVLRSQGVDNGVTVSLNDAAGRPFIAVSNIGTEDRSQAVTRTWQYEDAVLPGRLLSMTEQATGEAARVVERFVYASNTDTDKALNLAGACVSHYDTAGLVQTDSVALTGVPLSVTRHLLKDADNPDSTVDWQGEDPSVWNDRLATELYTTLTAADAIGAVLTTTDAAGHVQRMAYDVAGALTGRWLTVKGTQKEQAVVTSLTYSAAGQTLREEHGNGVVTTYSYEPQTQRLTGIKTERPGGHASGAKVLQDLQYRYDPVGNVLRVTDDAEETRFWRNQKVVPENTYVYDSLYQLVSATGREMAGIAAQGNALPSVTVPLPADSNAFTAWTRAYRYDTGGNLTQIQHSAPATGNRYTTEITVSGRSNRAVLNTLAGTPDKVDGLFLASGHQTQLVPGQHLTWTPRGELSGVTPVTRDGLPSDRETYRYDAGRQRVIKTSVQKTGGSTRTQRTLYLPGLEVRTTKHGDSESEVLQTITLGNVRVLHRVSGKSDAGETDNPIRYSYGNLTGSCGLEVDGEGKVITQEEYYPYGGTAVWTSRSRAEADDKTRRYSGKERDASGLYYYGYRYYQPWAGRWLSSDPAGTVDGLNLYRMVRNNPVLLYDPQGLAGKTLASPQVYEQAADHFERKLDMPLVAGAIRNEWTQLYHTRNYAAFPDNEDHYRFAIQAYTTPFYKQINKRKRGIAFDKVDQGAIKSFYQKNVPGSMEIFFKKKMIGKNVANYEGAVDSIINALDSGLRKVPSPPAGRNFVARGINLEPAELSWLRKQHHTVGGVVVEPGYMSATFSRPFLKKDLVIIEMSENHKGKYVAPLSITPQEDEIIFPPGTSYEIKNVLTVSELPQLSMITTQFEDFHISQDVNTEVKEAKRLNPNWGVEDYIERMVFAKML